MIRADFQYHRPALPDEAAALLACDDGPVVILGGGTLVVPMMTRGEIEPRHVIDLGRLGLSEIRREADKLVIGALSDYVALAGSPAIREHAPLLASVCDGITGGPQIRSYGTIGGSACYANPASDIPACLVALDATFLVVSARGTRGIGAADFFRGAFSTALERGEFLSEIVVPLFKPQARCGYYKLKFCESSWPIATASCLLTPEADGLYTITLSLGGVEPVPRLIRLRNQPWGGEHANSHVGRLSELVSSQITSGWTDELADGDYRRAVSGIVATRAITAAHQDTMDQTS
jgi:CO/xanthine dehydrogenase FAD-binding subunit